MKQGRSTTTPTEAEALRFQQIRRVGCIACWLHGKTRKVACEVHHLTIGGRHGQKRRGHEFSVGLCPWHHRGVQNPGTSAKAMTKAHGPSYAREPKPFRDRYGEDAFLLEAQAQMISRLPPAGECDHEDFDQDT